MFDVIVLYKHEVQCIFFYPTYRKINLAHCYILDCICDGLSVLMNVKSTFQFFFFAYLLEFFSWISINWLFD